ncbi:MAG: hypothetical protein IPI49_19610 [Myxococcales bacterium]|nr:hypothetical protein [Myxococcales bacterium]
MSEQAYRAWKQVPAHRRRQLDVTLRQIYSLGTAHARPYLSELAEQLWDVAAVRQSRTWSARDLAAQLYLANEEKLLALQASYAVDPMDYVWEYRGPSSARLMPVADAKRHVAERVECYLSATSYGHQCYVEDYLSADQLRIAIYHEGETMPVETLQGRELRVHWARPLCRMAAMYLVDTCTLFVRAVRQPDAEFLRDLVARIYFDNPAHFADPLIVPRFSFHRLIDPDHPLFTKGEDQIDHISLLRVVALSPHRAVSQLTVDLRPMASLEETRAVLASHGVLVSSAQLSGVRLLFAFSGQGRSRLRTVHLQNPNTSNFDGTVRDCLIRGYLLKWGIDVEPPRAVAAPAR